LYANVQVEIGFYKKFTIFSTSDKLRRWFLWEKPIFGGACRICTGDAVRPMEAVIRSPQSVIERKTTG